MKFSIRQFAALTLLLLGVKTVQAATKTATISSGTSITWSSLTWSPTGAPVAGDDVIITFNVGSAGNFNITGVPAATPSLGSYASFTVNGSGSGTLTFTGSTSTIWTNRLDISVNVTFSGVSNSLSSLNSSLSTNRVASGKTFTINTGTFGVASGGVFTVNGTLISGSGGSISTTANSQLVVPSGGTVRYNPANGNNPQISPITVQAGGFLILNGTATSGTNSFPFPSSVSIAISGTLSVQGDSGFNTSSGLSPTYSAGSTLEYKNAEVWTVNTKEWPTTNGPTNIIIDNSAGSTGITLNADRTITGTLTLANGVLTLSGSSTDLTFTTPASTQAITRSNGRMNCTSSPSLAFTPASGAGNWSIPTGTFGSDQTLTNFTSNMPSGSSLTLSDRQITVSSTFTQSSGLLILGSGDLVMPSSYSGYSGSATRMIVTSAASGFVERSFSSFQSFTFPIGENVGTAEYSGFSFTLNSSTSPTSRTVGFKVVDDNPPNNGSPSHYLSRYWVSALSSSAGTYSYTVTLPYNGTTGDIVGTESKIGPSYWDGTKWIGMGGTISTSSDWLSISSGTQLNAPLGFTIAGRALDNDDPCGATTLTPGAAGAGCTGSVSASTAGATQFTTGCSGTADDDVWFRFVATATSHNVRVTPSASMNPELQAYTLSSGSCPSTASFSAVSSTCTNSASTGAVENMTLTGLTSGTTYYVRVYDSSSSISADPSFSICVMTPPANDEPCGAVTLTAGTAGSATCTTSSSGDAALASQTINSFSCSGPSTQADVWYKFVATATSHTVRVVGNSTYDPIVQIHTASGSCPSLSMSNYGSPSCSNGTSAGGTESHQLTGLTIGNTYYARVYHSSSTVPSNTTFTICVLTPFQNDEICNGSTNTAVLLTPGSSCSPTSGDVALASQTINSSSCSGPATQADVWYRFVATATSHMVQVTGNGTFDPIVQGYTVSGSCPSIGTPSAYGSPSCVNATSGGGTENMQMTGLTVGNTYYVRVYHSSSTVPSNTTFSICVLSPPANDEPCGAVSLTPGSSCSPTAGSAALASQTINSFSCSGPTTQADVWYKFTATSTSHFVQVTSNGTYDAIVQGYSTTGSCPSSLSTSAWGSPSCVNDNSTGGTETLQMSGLTIGNTYYVRVYHSSSTVPSNTTFSICVLNPATNDTPCGATTLTVGAATCSSTAGTTAYSSQSYSGCNGNANDDVWYKFVATSSAQTIVVDGDAGFDAVIQAYTQTGGTCPSGTFASISGTCTDGTTNGGVETLSLTGLTSGNTYYVRVYDYYTSPSSNNFTICIIGPPANDDLCGAVTLSPSSSCSTTSGDVNYATQTINNSACSFISTQRDVWYKFTAAAVAQTISVTGSASFDAVVQLFTASTCSNTPVAVSGACADNTSTGGTETMQVTGLTIGTTYYIRVFHENSSVPSTTTFTICVINPPANDECSGAISLGTINSTCSATSGDIAAATQSQTASPCAFGSNIKDIWYSFVASGTTANVVVTGGGSSFDAVVQAFSGSCGSLTSIGCRQYWSTGTDVLGLTGLTNGATYYVRVFHDTWWSSNPTHTTFTICVVTPPSNDYCTGATALTSGSTLSGQTTALASQAIDSYYDTGYDDDDLWYSFTPSGTSARFTLTSGTLDGVLELRSTSCNGFRNVAHDYTSTGETEVINVTGLTPSSTYRLRVFSYGSARGTFSILASNNAYTPGTYDNIGSAYVCSTGTNAPGVSYTNYGMEIGEPSGTNWSFDPDANTGVSLGNTAWFVFTPTTSGRYQFSGTTGGGSFAMAVYQASSASALLSGSFSEVSSAPASSSSSQYACLTAGQNYYIQFNGNLAASGTPSLTITSADPVTQPTASSATGISCSGFTANWSAVANALSYRIDVSTDESFTNIVLNDADAGTGTSYAVSGLSPGTNFYYRIRGAACGILTPSSSGVLVEVLPSAITATSNATTLCEGLSFDLNATGGSGADTWAWSGPSFSDSNQNPDAFNVNPSSGGSYSVTATNSCGSTSGNTIVLTVNPLTGSAGAISGAISVCEGTTDEAYSIAAVNNADSYIWSYTGTGATVNGTGENITIDFAIGATGGDLTVTPTNGCGDGTASPVLTIGINAQQVWYLDADEDGYAISTLSSCDSPGVDYTLTVLPLTDCDDSNSAFNPDAVWYLDADSDGYALSSSISCLSPGTGYTLTALPISDCDDGNSALNPNTMWYLDADSDGYAAGSSVSCNSPGEGYVLTVLPLTDCNDNNGAVNPGGTEVCGNGIDDNCNSETDEGCGPPPPNNNRSSATGINAYAGACLATNGTVQNATVSTESNSTATTGQDVWYRFTATKPGLRIEVNTNNFDALIELQTSSGTTIATENAVSGVGSEYLNFEGPLTIGATYFISVRNFNSALGTGSFSICLLTLSSSGCNSGPGPFTSCNTFKAISTFASSYTFNFTNTTTSQVTSVTTVGSTVISLGILVPGYNYLTSVSCTYNLFDGAGNPESLTFHNTNACTITMLPHADIDLREIDQCPPIGNARARNAVIGSNTWLCGAHDYQWEFHPQPSGLPIQVAGPPTNRFLALGTVPALVAGSTYNVRIRPRFNTGLTAGDWGPDYQCLRIIGPGGLAEEDSTIPTISRLAVTADHSDGYSVSIYPNPTSGEYCTLRLDGFASSTVGINVTDMSGKTIFTRRVALTGNTLIPLEFSEQLNSGVYIIKISANENDTYHRLVVQP